MKQEVGSRCFQMSLIPKRLLQKPYYWPYKKRQKCSGLNFVCVIIPCFCKKVIKKTCVRRKGIHFHSTVIWLPVTAQSQREEIAQSARKQTVLRSFKTFLISKYIKIASFVKRDNNFDGSGSGVAQGRAYNQPDYFVQFQMIQLLVLYTFGPPLNKFKTCHSDMTAGPRKIGPELWMIRKACYT